MKMKITVTAFSYVCIRKPNASDCCNSERACEYALEYANEHSPWRSLIRMGVCVLVGACFAVCESWCEYNRSFI